MQTTPSIVIVGGGISGLSAAYRIQELARREGMRPRITVLESGQRLGGVIKTLNRQGFVLECGPDSFMGEKPAAIELCKRLGLEDELIGVTPANRKFYLCENGRLMTFPAGFRLMAPSDLATLCGIPFLSLRGKIRAGCELFIGARVSSQDESIGSFVRRRFGDEMLERIAKPLLGSIYAGDLDDLSMQAYLPMFVQMEKQYGSLLRAFSARKKAAASSGPRKPAGSQYGMFVTLRSGLEALCRALVGQMGEVEFLTGCPVESVYRDQNWKVRLEDGRILGADFLCMALPAVQAARFFSRSGPRMAELLESIATKSMMAVNLGFRAGEVTLPAGSGFVGASGPGLKILGCSFSSQKFEGRAPQGSILVRAFLGTEGCEELAGCSDEQVALRVADQIKCVLKATQLPFLFEVSRYLKKMPQYETGHLARIQRIEKELSLMPDLFLVGNSFYGSGVTDCITHAEAVAEKLFERVAQVRQASSSSVPMKAE